MGVVLAKDATECDARLAGAHPLRGIQDHRRGDVQIARHANARIARVTLSSDSL
jgi:hypothetical protein